jgi:hypothetical protein
MERLWRKRKRGEKGKKFDRKKFERQKIRGK